MEIVKTMLIGFDECARCGSVVALGDYHPEIGCDN
jgi:hypothetical protein